MDYIDWYGVFKLLFVLMLALHLLQHVPGTDHRHLKRNWWNQLVITGLFAYAILFFFCLVHYLDCLPAGNVLLISRSEDAVQEP